MTRKVCESVKPLLRPVAWILCRPGKAVAGMVMPREKLPRLLVLVLPTMVVVLKVVMTVSLLPKPVPSTVSVVVGGPVTFESVMDALAGVAVRTLTFVYAKLKAEIRTKTGLKRFLPGTLSGDFENAEVELVRWQGSGDLAAVARSNCYVVVPPDRERIPAGEWMPILLR